jgi:hypothetical protein
MNEIEFRPKHNWFSIIFIGLLIISLGGLTLWFGYKSNKISFLLSGLAMLLLGVYSIARRSTLIIIGGSEVVMKRVLLPELILDFDNFTDFIGNAFLFGNKGIPLDDMTNAKEFVEVFAPILEAKNIRPKGKYVADVKRTNKAAKLAIFPAIILSFVVIYFLSPYIDTYDTRLIDGGIFILVVVIVYFILKKIEDFKKEQ